MMIQVNLLPGLVKPVDAEPGTDWRAIASRLRVSIRYPWFVGTAVVSVVAIAAVLLLHLQQQQRRDVLVLRRANAEREANRYARVLGTRRRLHDERDAIGRQLEIIRSIDDNRYAWAHVLDEVSRALPAYTWLTSMEQTSGVPATPATAPTPAATPARGTKNASRAAVPADTVPTSTALTFRIIGQTVDIQALTLFMRQLEGSAFIQQVTLAKSEEVAVDGTTVTQFQLTASYEAPGAARLQTTRLVVPLR
jgi:Tfp pilus assembly protein PilN